MADVSFVPGSYYCGVGGAELVITIHRKLLGSLNFDPELRSLIWVGQPIESGAIGKLSGTQSLVEVGYFLMLRSCPGSFVDPRMPLGL